MSPGLVDGIRERSSCPWAGMCQAPRRHHLIKFHHRSPVSQMWRLQVTSVRSAHHPGGPMMRKVSLLRGRQAGGTPESTVSAEPALGFLLQGGEVGVCQRRGGSLLLTAAQALLSANPLQPRRLFLNRVSPSVQVPCPHLLMHPSTPNSALQALGLSPSPSTYLPGAALPNLRPSPYQTGLTR